MSQQLGYVVGTDGTAQRSLRRVPKGPSPKSELRPRVGQLGRITVGDGPGRSRGRVAGPRGRGECWQYGSDLEPGGTAPPAEELSGGNRTVRKSHRASQR